MPPKPASKYPVEIPDPNDLNDFSSVATHLLAVLGVLGVDPLVNVPETTLRAWLERINSSGKIDADAVQTATFGDEATERTFYSLTIPANTLEVGDLVQFYYTCEVVALASGELRLRTWLGPVGVTQLISGFLARTSVGLVGFEFTQFTVVDVGGGVTQLRGGASAGVDVVIDLSVENTINCTAQMTIANVGNTYRGVSAYVGTI